MSSESERIERLERRLDRTRRELARARRESMRFWDVVGVVVLVWLLPLAIIPIAVLGLIGLVMSGLNRLAGKGRGMGRSATLRRRVHRAE